LFTVSKASRAGLTRHNVTPWGKLLELSVSNATGTPPITHHMNRLIPRRPLLKQILGISPAAVSVPELTALPTGPCRC